MKSRINSLDGLRGILCILVVLHHYDAKYIPTFFFENFIIRQADLLVDFFFIMSGFVISLNYKQFYSFDDIRVFLKKRFLRLYPLLLFSTIIFFLFELFSRNLFGNFINKDIDNTSLIKSFIDTILLNNSTSLFGNSWGINRILRVSFIFN
jgi:peptidoglycan/LPS O-acetylase OafA/YrhL